MIGFNQARVVINMFKLVVLLALFGVTLGLPAKSAVQDVAPKIIGGEETDIEHNPWQLALLYLSQHLCGAVEIHPQWAITIAQCLEDAIIDNISIRAGSTTKSSGGQLIKVLRAYKHPKFNRTTADYDFALLELDEPITIQTAAPVALPEPNKEVLKGQNATITGWGSFDADYSSPEILHLVKVPVMEYELCQKTYPFRTITDRMFCTGDDNGEKNACEGDGGGPVIIDGLLVGLVSWGWGLGCGAPDAPGVNAKLSTVMEWVYETSGINSTSYSIYK